MDKNTLMENILWYYICDRGTELSRLLLDMCGIKFSQPTLIFTRFNT